MSQPTSDITDKRRELWRRISDLWLGGLDLKRMSVRLDLMDDELASEMEAMKRHGYALDTRVRGGVFQDDEVEPRTIELGSLQVRTRRGPNASKKSGKTY